MFYEVGSVSSETPVVTFVHDCQVVETPLEPKPYDSVADFIVTPTRFIEVKHPQKPTTGVVWKKLEPGMLESIPPLAQLKLFQKGGDADKT